MDDHQHFLFLVLPLFSLLTVDPTIPSHSSSSSSTGLDRQLSKQSSGSSSTDSVPSSPIFPFSLSQYSFILIRPHLTFDTSEQVIVPRYILLYSVARHFCSAIIFTSLRQVQYHTIDQASHFQHKRIQTRSRRQFQLHYTNHHTWCYLNTSLPPGSPTSHLSTFCIFGTTCSCTAPRITSLPLNRISTHQHHDSGILLAAKSAPVLLLK